MTDETTVTTPEATTTPAVATSCCSENHTHSHAMPVASALPVASDCCSSSTGCSTEGQTPVEAGPPVDDAALIDALREVIDPELMINIVDLGLVYAINHTDRKVNVDMTLTSPACPAGPQIIMQSKMALEKLDGIDVAEIKLVMSPPWSPARMTDEARDQLGIF